MRAWWAPRLEEASAHLNIHLEDRALDPEYLLCEEHPFVLFVLFVDHFFYAG